jgi:hypothetical protein
MGGVCVRLTGKEVMLVIKFWMLLAENPVLPAGTLVPGAQGRVAQGGWNACAFRDLTVRIRKRRRS